MTPHLPLRLVLASQSHRRRELAISSGWDITVLPPPEQAEASAPPRQTGETVAELVTRLAHVKASAVSRLLPQLETRAILACDTVGEIEGSILGKPSDVHDARRMIEALSGKKHHVFTGVSIWFPETPNTNDPDTMPRRYTKSKGVHRVKSLWNHSTKKKLTRTWQQINGVARQVHAAFKTDFYLFVYLREPPTMLLAYLLNLSNN